MPHSCLQSMCRHMTEAMVVTDVHGRIVHVNPAFEDHTGYSRAEVLGRNPRLLKSGHHDDSFYEHLWHSLLRGRTWRKRVVNRCKNGSLIDVQQVICPVFSRHGLITHFVSVWRDVTRERELLEMARRSQRLEQFGQLAAEIAHDFHGALTGIRGFAQLALNTAPVGGTDATYVKEILNCTHRASKLARQLLDMGKQGSDGSGKCDPNAVIAQMIPFLRHSLSTVEVVFQADWEVGQARIDSLQLEQILMNLAVNARDAMGGDGTLTLRTSAVPDCRAGAGADEPPMVRISVSDTGCGIPPDGLKRIFEPFFTTKGSAGGTGLGLAIVRGILEDVNGIVDVQSELGQGTAFHILIPQCREAATGVPPAPDANQGHAGHGSVLVFEHDKSVREMACQMLEHLGYCVTGTEDGHAAVELASRSDPPFDVALVEAEPALMSGDRLVEAIREVSPGCRILLATPYGQRYEHLLSEQVRVLQKPFGVPELSKAVHDVLVR